MILPYKLEQMPVLKGWSCSLFRTGAHLHGMQ